VNPPREYSLQELANDVRALINHLHEHGILGLHPGVDFNAMTILTEDGEVDVDVSEDAIDVEVSSAIVEKIRLFTSWQEPTD
jgi:hypothetical protein